MKYILVLDRADEQRMHQGEMIPIPGQIETFITMEPKRGRGEVQVEETPARTRAQRAQLPLVKCTDCGEAFRGKVGVSTHSRHCYGGKRRALQAPTHNGATCKYCRRSFRNVQARSAHQGACPYKTMKKEETAHA